MNQGDPEAFRQYALAEIERWVIPATDEERQLVAEIEALPFFEVDRGPTEILQMLGMESQRCHLNAREYCEGEPDHRVVSGWVRGVDPSGRNCYFSHSVIHDGRNHICVTPGNGPPVLEFAHDPHVTFMEDDARLIVLRNGNKLPLIARSDPEGTIEDAQVIKDRLLSGMDPWEAIKDAV